MATSSGRSRHVAVIGAGVVGLCVALELARRDVRVTVLDAAGPGNGASSVNAGWIVPSLAGPVPAPGVVGTALRWLLRHDSPLRIAPVMSFADVRWLYGFARASSARRYRAGLIATAELCASTFALYDRLAAEGVAFEMHRDGVLFTYGHTDDMEADRRELHELTPFGYTVPEALTGDAVREVEPALSASIRAAYLVEGERSLRPESLMAGLARRLGEQGVTIRRETPCLGFVARGDRVAAATVPGGEIDADAFVVAAGVATTRLLARAGARVPIRAGKGYTLDFAPPPLSLRRPVYLHDDRLAITPFDGTLRVAGMMELGATNAGIPEARLRTMTGAMARAFDAWPSSPGSVTPMTGARPMAPDGLPVIGMVPGFRNLAVASGHAMLGVTLAPATAVALAHLITTGERPDVLRPFDPGRFGGRRLGGS